VRRDEMHRPWLGIATQLPCLQHQRRCCELDRAWVDVDAVEVVLEDRLDDRAITPLLGV
jgi:hypothetical protein